MSVSEIVAHMASCWSGQTRATYSYQNLHTMFLQTTDSELAATYDGGLPIVDGLPIVAMLRAAGHEVTREHRVTGVDLLHPVLRQAEEDNTNVFIVGQREPVLRAALDVLREAYPSIKIDGHHGYFDTDGEASEDVIELANSHQAGLVIVGLGTPKSELWVHGNRAAFDAAVVWSAGALMEYVAGDVPTPPRWSGPLGLEWAFRMASDPKRFVFRYCVEPPLLLLRLLMDRTRR